MTKAEFCTAKWNNIIAIALGVPVHILMAFMIFKPVMSPVTTFWVIQVVGAVY